MTNKAEPGKQTQDTACGTRLCWFRGREDRAVVESRQGYIAAWSRGDGLPEYAQFAGAMVLFLGILIGSYWFVLAPTSQRKERRGESERGGE